MVIFHSYVNVYQRVILGGWARALHIFLRMNDAPENVGAIRWLTCRFMVALRRVHVGSFQNNPAQQTHRRIIFQTWFIDGIIYIYICHCTLLWPSVWPSKCSKPSMANTSRPRNVFWLNISMEGFSIWEYLQRNMPRWFVVGRLTKESGVLNNVYIYIYLYMSKDLTDLTSQTCGCEMIMPGIEIGESTCDWDDSADRRIVRVIFYSSVAATFWRISNISENQDFWAIPERNQEEHAIPVCVGGQSWNHLKTIRRQRFSRRQWIDRLVDDSWPDFTFIQWFTHISHIGTGWYIAFSSWQSEQPCCYAWLDGCSHE